jgi:hypothetical protein
MKDPIREIIEGASYGGLRDDEEEVAADGDVLPGKGTVREDEDEKKGWKKAAQKLLSASVSSAKMKRDNDGMGYRAYLRAIIAGQPAEHLTKKTGELGKGAKKARQALIDEYGTMKESKMDLAEGMRSGTEREFSAVRNYPHAQVKFMHAGRGGKVQDISVTYMGKEIGHMTKMGDRVSNVSVDPEFLPGGKKKDAKTEAKLDEVSTKDGKATVAVWVEIMAGAVTSYDRRVSARERNPNIHRIAHLLEAVHDIEKAMKSSLDKDDPSTLDRLVSEMKKAFIFERGKFSIGALNKVVKKIDEYKRSGKLPKYETLDAAELTSTLAEALDEDRGGSTPFECQECGRQFKKKLTASTVDVKCPKCGGVDTLPTDYFGISRGAGSKTRGQNESVDEADLGKIKAALAVHADRAWKSARKGEGWPDSYKQKYTSGYMKGIRDREAGKYKDRKPDSSDPGDRGYADAGWGTLPMSKKEAVEESMKGFAIVDKKTGKSTTSPRHLFPSADAADKALEKDPHQTTKTHQVIDAKYLNWSAFESTEAKEPTKTGAELDMVTKAPLKFLDKPGVKKGLKKAINKRARQSGKKDIQQQDETEVGEKGLPKGEYWAQKGKTPWGAKARHQQGKATSGKSRKLDALLKKTRGENTSAEDATEAKYKGDKSFKQTSIGMPSVDDKSWRKKKAKADAEYIPYDPKTGKGPYKNKKDQAADKPVKSEATEPVMEPGFVKTPEDEKKWADAKAQAKKSKPDDFYALANHIYHKMKGESTVAEGLTDKERNAGWNKNGEWTCPKCGTGYGKNLKGEQPFALVYQHAKTCTGKAPKRKENVDEGTDPVHNAMATLKKQRADAAKKGNKRRVKELDKALKLMGESEVEEGKKPEGGAATAWRQAVRSAWGQGMKNPAMRKQAQQGFTKGYGSKAPNPYPKGTPEYKGYSLAQQTTGTQKSWQESFKSVLGEAMDPPIIRDLRKIVDRKTAGRAGGQKVDMYTASAIINVYDKLNPGNKASLAKLPLLKMADLAFKLIKKAGG